MEGECPSSFDVLFAELVTQKWDDETFSVGLTRFLNRGATTWVDGKPADAKVLDVQDCGGKKTWIDYMAQPLRTWSYQPGVAARRCQNFFINGVGPIFDVERSQSDPLCTH